MLGGKFKMEILVCIKQVPDDSVEVKFNVEKGSAVIDEITRVVNAFDTYSLEMATRFKEAVGGNITVVSIGEEKVKDAIRSALSVGADKGFAAIDEEFIGSDTIGISYILAKAAKKIEDINGVKFDVIFCGQEATDFTSGQVGQQLAEILNYGQITNIVDIESIDKGISAKQETEEGYRVVEGEIPVVVTVSKPNYEPRYPTMKAKMAARKMEIPVLTVDDLDIEKDKVGEKGAVIKVIKNFAPAKKSAGVKMKEEDAVVKAVKLMADASVL